MKRFIKTISLFLSIFLTVSMIVTFPAAAAAEHEVSGAAKIEANSSVGTILGAAAEQNKQSFALSEVVSNVTIEGKTAVVKLLHTKACMIVVGVYDESGNQLLQTAVRRGIHAEEETVTLDFESDLPAYFYLRAFILDNDCAPLGKPFESNRYTLAYKRFLEKTTADFPAENVVNFDDEADNNMLQIILPDGFFLAALPGFSAVAGVIIVRFPIFGRAGIAGHGIAAEPAERLPGQKEIRLALFHVATCFLLHKLRSLPFFC